MVSLISVSFPAPKNWAAAIFAPAPSALQKAGHGIGEADCAQGGGADEIAYDHTVGEIVEHLQ